MRVRVIATPGHTFTHLAYALEDTTSGEAVAVFTGGSLLYGSAGRPDLLGAEHAPALAAAQYASIRRLAAKLPDQAAVHPTHGFGSFCAATVSGAEDSTIGEERRVNPALALGEDSYVAGMLAGLDDYPAYYARMAPANAAGPAAPDLTPPATSGAAQISRRIAAGEWVVDLRGRRAFAAGHLPGSLSFEYGDSLVANLGWLLPPGIPLTLIGDSAGQVADAQRDLARIGIERVAGTAGPPHERRGTARRLASYPRLRLRGPGRGQPRSAGRRPRCPPPAGVVGRPHRGRAARSPAPPARPPRRPAAGSDLGPLPDRVPRQRRRLAPARGRAHRHRHRRRLQPRGARRATAHDTTAVRPPHHDLTHIRALELRPVREIS
jgi:glyoxylase-like metal-dependent hydrolase (beta-lactamase superfamily II)